MLLVLLIFLLSRKQREPKNGKMISDGEMKLCECRTYTEFTRDLSSVLLVNPTNWQGAKEIWYNTAEESGGS